jgi:hypothetical protein
MKYNIDYFIEKFTGIPENQIGDSQSGGCAYGQCRTSFYSDGSQSPEGLALTALMETIPGLTAAKTATYLPHEGTPARINNGDILQYQQSTPKQRILAALHDIKNMQSVVNSAIVELNHQNHDH